MFRCSISFPLTTEHEHTSTDLYHYCRESLLTHIRCWKLNNSRRRKWHPACWHVDATALWKSASSRVSDRIIWKQCQATVSVRKGSFFDKSQLPLTKLCDLLYYRSIDVSMAETVPSIVIILSGTRIWSDKWAAYAGLNQVGYIHDTVRVPMLNFVWTNHRCFVVCQVKSH